ncbi:hypothetical protein RvY_07081 [Ramazzottius varieornatus]|uniref:Uncharacterized protein n=1 Tax=Ramazzottius varieornatus TaxID=947166 RepID=A0A1D1V0U6_RAMVA|nr:hypothetical protein RvY_07081 [Ramazzottius varieornatus]
MSSRLDELEVGMNGIGSRVGELETWMNHRFVDMEKRTNERSIQHLEKELAKISTPSRK